MNTTPSPLLSLQDIATQPRWSLDELIALPGQCTGGALRDWSTHVNRRWGPDAEQVIRDQLGTLDQQLPALPTDKEWLPIGCQLRTTDVIIDHFLDGDAMQLEDLLWEDVQRNSKPTGQRLMQWIGPKIVLRQLPHIHRHIYNVGQAAAKIERKRATLTFHDSRLFANPTWQLLSGFGLRLYLRCIERKVTQLKGQQLSPTSFQYQINWNR